MKQSAGKDKQKDGAPTSDANSAAAPPEKLYVNVLLQGDEVAQFLKYQKARFLRSKSEVGRSLMLERLSQLPPAA